MSSLRDAQFEAEIPRGPEADAERGSLLLRKARGGDRMAFGQIVILYQDRLFNSVLRMVGDPEEARELTQEAFTRGLEKLDTFRGESGPYTWLFRIGMNLAFSSLRRSVRRRTFSLDGRPGNDGAGNQAGTQAAGLAERLAVAGPGPAEEAEQRERGERVAAALGRLDPEYRAVLVMRDVEGFDYEQMAHVLELPLGTLKSRLFRARLALRDELAPYMEGKQ